MEFFFGTSLSLIHGTSNVLQKKNSTMKKYKGVKPTQTYIPQIIDYFVKFFLCSPVFSVNLRSDIAWSIIDYNDSRVGPLFVQYHILLKLVLKEHS